MHARLASGLLLAVGIADLAVLNLLLAPRLAEMGKASRRGVVVATEKADDVEAPAGVGQASPLPLNPVAAAGRGASEAAPDILFEIGEARVHGTRAADVRRVAEALRAPGAGRLLLRGHTDRLGLRGSNVELSRRRAEAVLRLLVAFGAPAGRVDTEAIGDAEPASDVDTPLGWAKNRRVQLLWR
jgi:outer membrane protein OmpA-like peptidoglycan-associated protein